MDDPADSSPLSAQDAARALIALGWPVAPNGLDEDGWLVGGTVLNDEDLVALAVYNGVHPPHERVQ